MINFIAKFILIFLVTGFSISCSASKAENKYSNYIESNKTFGVWALADIQPKDLTDKKAFEDSVKDINENVQGLNIAIVAGDIVEKTEEEVFDWYLENKKISYINQFYEIIGNHDLKSDMGLLFREKVRDEVHYTAIFGNILFVFVSDEQRGKATIINDDTFEWWRNIIRNNQDKIIVMVSHAPLDVSEIPFSNFEDRKIKDSSRFVKVLKNYQVDLWLSGHIHVPHSFDRTINTNENLNDIDFIHISSIRPEIGGLKHSESRILNFICGTNKVIILSRDHTMKDWQGNLSKEIELSKEVVCN